MKKSRWRRGLGDPSFERAMGLNPGKAMPCEMGITLAYSDSWSKEKMSQKCHAALAMLEGFWMCKSLSPPLHRRLAARPSHSTVRRRDQSMFCTESSLLDVVGAGGRGSSICYNMRRAADVFRSADRELVRNSPTVGDGGSWGELK